MFFDDDGWEEIPGYSDLLDAMKKFMDKQLELNSTVSFDPVGEQTYFNFSSTDVCFVIFTAVIWTVLREVSTRLFFKPYGLRCVLTPFNQEKLPESAWKFLYFTSAWCFNFYILVWSGEYEFFQKPSTVWDGWNLNESLPNNMYYFYIAQCGFYLHSIYATMFMDSWKKDSVIMIVHHISTLILISLSFALRCHNIGCMVLFLHDVCDIFLELSKLNVYLKIQNNVTVKLHEFHANCSFGLFTLIWIAARLYWFPLRVLYTAISDKVPPAVPCLFVMNILLWLLQILNIYWFYLILQTLYRVTTGQLQEDAREYDVQARLSSKKE